MKLELLLPGPPVTTRPAPLTLPTKRLSVELEPLMVDLSVYAPGPGVGVGARPCVRLLLKAAEPNSGRPSEKDVLP